MSDFIYCLTVSYPTKYGVGKKQFYFSDRKEAEVFRLAVQGDNSKVNQVIGLIPETCKTALEKLKRSIAQGRNEPANRPQLY